MVLFSWSVMVESRSGESPFHFVDGGDNPLYIKGEVGNEITGEY